MSKIKIDLTIVPAVGSAIKKSSHELEIQPRAILVKDLLREAGCNPKGMQVSVNGKPVDLDTYVVDGSRVQVEPQEVVVSERASGS